MSQLIEFYDTTLRDGTQAENFNLSVDDKIRITQQLDKLGIDFVEGGWPGSNPPDKDPNLLAPVRRAESKQKAVDFQVVLWRG